MLLPIILFSGIREPVVEFLIMFCACLSQKKKKKKIFVRVGLNLGIVA